METIKETSNGVQRLTLDQMRLKNAPQSANIPFEVRSGSEGREEIWNASRFKEQVARIQEEYLVRLRRWVEAFRCERNATPLSSKQ